VSATPTIFVNSMRVGALQSPDELRSLIQRVAQNPTGGTK
jgi:protein-disulfide isomerase